MTKDLPKFPLTENLLYRVAVFWSRINITVGPDECWVWDGTRHPTGYGMFWLNGETYRTHRIALYLTLKRPLEGQVVMHTCDNPPCCNPRHLREASIKENVLDMMAKGRHGYKTTVHRTNIVLTEQQVLDIRAKLAKGTSHRQLSREYGVCTTNIHSIRTRKTWNHIKLRS